LPIVAFWEISWRREEVVVAVRRDHFVENVENVESQPLLEVLRVTTPWRLIVEIAMAIVGHCPRK
jgi:hypothetical protein